MNIFKRIKNLWNISSHEIPESTEKSILTTLTKKPVAMVVKREDAVESFLES